MGITQIRSLSAKDRRLDLRIIIIPVLRHQIDLDLTLVLFIEF